MSHHPHGKSRQGWPGQLTLAILAAVALAGMAFWWVEAREWVSTDDAYITGHLVTLVAQTSGTVVELLTENTHAVKAGAVLVRLDGARSRFAWEEAKAHLGDTVRRIAARFADAERLRHQIEARLAVLDRLRHDRDRYRPAVAEEAIPRQQLQNTEDQIRETEALVEQARAELAGVEATLHGATAATHPAVAEAAASLRQKYLEYSRREIVAPASGQIAKRKVQVGDRVEPGTPLLAILPLDHLWVEANLKEKDLERVRPGQEAEIIVDMLGRRQPYHGRVEGIHPGTGSLFALLPPENTSGNFIHISERVPVRIALSAEELQARPLMQGLSTFTRIHVRDNGRSPMQSDVETRHPGYRTSVFDGEARAADEQIQAIIRANLPGGHFKNPAFDNPP